MESPLSVAAASAISSFLTTTDRGQLEWRLSTFQRLQDSSALPWEANTCPGVASHPRAAHDPISTTDDPISMTAAPKLPREPHPALFQPGPLSPSSAVPRPVPTLVLDGLLGGARGLSLGLQLQPGQRRGRRSLRLIRRGLAGLRDHLGFRLLFGGPGTEDTGSVTARAVTLPGRGPAGRGARPRRCR